jgi:hypothetical protein
MYTSESAQHLVKQLQSVLHTTLPPPSLPAKPSLVFFESGIQCVIDGAIALVIAPHGLTDAWALPLAVWVPSYLIAALVGGLCPEVQLPWIGGLASAVHFAGDVGLWYALALVLLLVGLHLKAGNRGDTAAYVVLLSYMFAVHLPIHYARVGPSTPVWGWAALFLFACGSWAVDPVLLFRTSSVCRQAGVTLVLAHTIANSFTGDSALVARV